MALVVSQTGEQKALKNVKCTSEQQKEQHRIVKESHIFCGGGGDPRSYFPLGVWRHPCFPKSSF